jgi:NADH:ubiquinone oxidoreductase subunit 6 (subunit J)
VCTVLGAIIAVFSGADRVHAHHPRRVRPHAICCVGLSGLYYFLGSPFLALMEILIYVGAVCVTIVFASCWPNRRRRWPRSSPANRPWAGGWTALGLLGSGGVRRHLAAGVPTRGWRPPRRGSDGSVADLGLAFLTRYSLAFELISLVLLVAILGALAIARGGRRTAQ